METSVKREDRKAAVAAYKDRKVAAGIYVVRCAATGQHWAGISPDLSKIWNRLSFSLRQGNEPARSLQAAWREHGAESFTFDPIEPIETEETPVHRDPVLRDRLAHWCKTLPAERI